MISIEQALTMLDKLKTFACERVDRKETVEWLDEEGASQASYATPENGWKIIRVGYPLLAVRTFTSEHVKSRIRGAYAIGVWHGKD